MIYVHVFDIQSINIYTLNNGFFKDDRKWDYGSTLIAEYNMDDFSFCRQSYYRIIHLIFAFRYQ